MLSPDTQAVLDAARVTPAPCVCPSCRPDLWDDNPTPLP